MCKSLLFIANRTVFLFFISVLVLFFSSNVFTQIKIKEKVELTPDKGVESFIWPYNGCEYDIFNTSQLYIKFEPDHISSGNSTIVSLWLDENYTWPFWRDSEPYLLRTITLDPDYGEIVRIGEGLYRISIPDTVTTDSVTVVFSYTNYDQSCSGWGEIEKKSQITDCIDCGLLLWETLTEDTAIDSFIIKPDSFVVYIDPEECYPGDTVQVVIKKRNADGTLADFPPEQTYEIAKLEGCMLGNILAGGDSGSYFYDVSQPIYFAAADTLVGDTTGTVLLQVGLVDNNKEIPLNQPRVIESNDCFIGSFVAENYKLEPLHVHKYTLTILSPTVEETYWINETPQMPSIICSAKLDNYSKGTVTFEWEFYVRYNINRHLFYTDDTLCSRIAMVKFADTTFAENNEITSWTNDFNVIALDSLLFVGKYYTCDDTIRTWEFGDYIFTGGWIWIQATAKNSQGKIIAFKQQYGGKILGQNADSNTVINFAEPKEFKAIVKHESSFGDGNFAQFNIVDKDQRYKKYGYKLEGWKYNRRGYPRYGVPNGFGLAQIDKQPYPNEMDLWNWKHNINDGRTRYEDGLKYARTYLNSFKHEYSNEILLMNAYQNYNTGGFYHEWDYKKQEWTALSYLKDKNGKIIEDKNYGGKVINVYNSLP